MKIRVKHLLSLLLLIGLAISCGKNNEEETTPVNHFKVNDTYYALSTGYQEDWGTGSYYDGYNIDLVLISDGISVDFDTYNATGKGHVLYFELFTAGENGIEAGEYVYADTEPYDTGTFDDGAYMINLDLSTEDAEKTGYFKSGTITVTKSGSVYEISIDGTDSSGNKITGYYKGSLILVDIESYFMMDPQDLDRDQLQILPDVY